MFIVFLQRETIVNMETKAHPSDRITEREQRNRRLSYEAATEGIVLLSNHDLLPIPPCKAALYGAGAAYTLIGGTGSGEINVRHNVTVLEGLENARFEIVTKDWIDRYDKQWKAAKSRFVKAGKRKAFIPTARVMNSLFALEFRYPTGDVLTEREIAQCDADTCFYVLSRQSGEGHDMKDQQGSFRLDETEITNIRLCAALFRRMVVIINSGSPIDLSPIDGIEGIGAVVYMGQSGMEGGNALAAVITGQCTPSGKLAVTWPASYQDVPFGEAFGQDPHHALYKEGIYVGYRYYDSFGVEPRYAFGYGMSYTTFTIHTLSVTLSEGTVRCEVCVTNTGSACSGKEVVQVYVSCPGEDTEYQRLVAFAKTDSLAPHASQTIQLSFPVACLSSYDEGQAQTVLQAGGYLVRIGTCSRRTEVVAVIRVDMKKVLARHRHLCPASHKVAELAHENRFDIPASVPELIIRTDDLTSIQYDYTATEERFAEPVQTLLQSFRAEDYAKFCAGTGMSGERGGFRTPGAVGHTTAAFISRGIPNAEMCDGPAGLRIEKRAVQYPDGNIKPVDPSISIYELLPDYILKWFVLGNPKKGQMLYQFVTAFPVEAVMAQTWNTSLSKRIGQALGEEMQEYGVTFWLAPAINIVRNPLCGRNYEYYSEDPFLSGQMAAAVTLGVQSHKGRYVTLKHFCANNQEAYRQSVSSEVDERVLREIYWKGFEIVVRLSKPQSVMMAYNKVNGTFCANSYDLCTNLLRREWNFDGLVMTDWMASGKDRADEAQCLLAGTDLIMPGGKQDVRTLIQACRSMRLPLSVLRQSAGRVMRALLLVGSE